MEEIRRLVMMFGMNGVDNVIKVYKDYNKKASDVLTPEA
jgi:hypothetical protein